MGKTFYEILGLDPGCSNAQIRKAFGKISLEYHPDKGGSTNVFQFLAMVRDVLLDTKKRKQYDAEGKGPFVGPWEEQERQEPPAAGMEDIELLAPDLNNCLINKLLCMRGMYEHKWGTMTLARALRMLQNPARPEAHVYVQCNLAKDAEVPLRLIPSSYQLDNIPSYSLPRLLRYACISGEDYMELDFPASHGRQIMKHAVKHGLPSDLLQEAFKDREAIKAWRGSFDAINASSVKRITNMLSYGSGGQRWVEQNELPEMPPRLQALKVQISGVANHAWETCPASWREAVKGRKRPKLTILSILCQAGESADLKQCVDKLPDHVTLHGYLGDSILVSRFDCTD